MLRVVAGLACFAACHSSVHFHDAGGVTPTDGADGDGDVDAIVDTAIDAPPDAPPPDAQDLTRVWVHANNPQASDGTPDTNAIVVFMDTTGAVVQASGVDQNGDVSTELPGGGTVTVLQAFDATGVNYRYEHITTFRGVKGGDSLHTGPEKDPTVLAGSMTSMTGTMPLDAWSAYPYFECGTGQSPSAPAQGTDVFRFYDSCRTSRFDVLMIENMAGTNEFVWQTGVSYNANGTFNVADNFQLMGHSNVTITNVPDNVTVATWLYTIVGQWPLQMELKNLGALASPGTMTTTLQYPPGAGSATVLYVGAGDIGTTRHKHALATTASAATLAVDLSELPLPALPSRPTQTTTGATWSQTFAGSPDARYVIWTGHWTDASSKTHYATWQFVEDPSTAASTTLIPLPSAYAADDPTQASALTLDGAGVTYVDYDNLADYDAIRGRGPAFAFVENHFSTTNHRAHTVSSP